MRYIVLTLLLMMLTPTISLTEENDTAFTTNILPNAGDTTSVVHVVGHLMEN